MSQLGVIFDDEFERYSKFNDNIKTDFKSVFLSTFALPFSGLAISAGLFAALTFIPVLKKVS